jgi:tripartite ATP-independent transporter DctP family solute receptor
MKNKLRFLFAIIFSSGLIACGGSVQSNSATASQAQAGEVPKTIVIASHIPPGSPENLAMIWMAEELEKRTNGSVKGEVYEGGTLGGETELGEQIQSGQIHLGIAGFAIQERYIRKYLIWGVPFLVDGDILNAVIDGKIGDAAKEAFAQNNFQFMGICMRGNRQLTTNRNVSTVRDVEGMKIRLPENSVWMDVWKELGAMPTPVASPEVFSALQTGVVEAQENPISSNYQKGLWEVQKYTVMTNHLVDLFIWLSPKNWLNGLNEDFRKMFVELSAACAQRATDITFEKESEYRSDMEKRGMSYIDKIDIQSFRDKARPAIERACNAFEPWVYEELQRVITQF